MTSQRVPATAMTPALSRAARDRMEMSRQHVRDRAYELYCKRRQEADALADWLQAEREMELMPCAGIETQGNEIHIEAGLPHFEAGQLSVFAEPDSILIEGRSGDEQFCRFTTLKLPALIRPESVKASLRSGVLVIRAAKAAQSRVAAPQVARPVAVAAR